MIKKIVWLVALLSLQALAAGTAHSDDREQIKLIGLPLSDHYAAIIAYEKYRKQMKHAKMRLKLLSRPELVRAYFISERDADTAMVAAPMALDMYAKDPDFHWITLLHRGGGALALNQSLHSQLHLSTEMFERRPDGQLATALQKLSTAGEPPLIAIPSIYSTEAVVLYKYLTERGMKMSVRKRSGADVLLKVIKAPQTVSFLQHEDALSRPAAIQQPLPWPHIAERQESGRLAWYSKDVMRAPLGHVGGLLIAKRHVMDNKREALQEVVDAIHQAARDIEAARRERGEKMGALIEMIQRWMPDHTADTIREVLTSRIDTINYNNLAVTDSAIEGVREIMRLAHEAGILRQEADLDQMADSSFTSQEAH